MDWLLVMRQTLIVIVIDLSVRNAHLRVRQSQTTVTAAGVSSDTRSSRYNGMITRLRCHGSQDAGSRCHSSPGKNKRFY